MFTYILPKNAAKLKRIFSTQQSFLEELYLALATEVVVEIDSEAVEELKSQIDRWLSGYAVPLEAIREAQRIKGLEERVEYELSIYEEDIRAEPDANYEFARHFCSFVEGDVIVDIASGFGWIPAILSRSRQVIAVDKNYSSEIVETPEGRFVSGTNIQIFVPGFKTYAEFCRAFWQNVGANLQRIEMVSGDATRLSEIPQVKKAQSATCFFGLNHIPEWKEVLREAERAGIEKIYIALYSEELAKFPVKGIYDWIERLGFQIVPIEEFKRHIAELGMNIEEIKHPNRAIYRIFRIYREPAR